MATKNLAASILPLPILPLVGVNRLHRDKDPGGTAIDFRGLLEAAPWRRPITDLNFERERRRRRRGRRRCAFKRMHRSDVEICLADLERGAPDPPPPVYAVLVTVLRNLQRNGFNARDGREARADVLGPLFNCRPRAIVQVRHGHVNEPVATDFEYAVTSFGVVLGNHPSHDAAWWALKLERFLVKTLEALIVFRGQVNASDTQRDIGICDITTEQSQIPVVLVMPRADANHHAPPAIPRDECGCRAGIFCAGGPLAVIDCETHVQPTDRGALVPETSAVVGLIEPRSHADERRAAFANPVRPCRHVIGARPFCVWRHNQTQEGVALKFELPVLRLVVML
mmetsp:Transcript_51213/g.129269  ORF Transcript_51213/g.129269 Transcript_51213/m.129269 type:complete len:340 (+) Transcript_51213:295-1314(+)